MVKCHFCGIDESIHRGLHLIRNDGVVTFFCSGKCRKNSLKLKRDRRKIKWTQAYRVERAKVVDKANVEAKANKVVKEPIAAK